MPTEKHGQVWLGKQLGITQPRVSQLVGQGRIPRKLIYTDADVIHLRQVLQEARAENNATASNDAPGPDGPYPINASDDDALRALSRNPVKLAQLRLIIERTAKIKLDRELKLGGYLKKDDVDRDRLARILSVKNRLAELSLRSALIANRSDAECATILTDWAREVCDYFAQGGE